MTILLTAACARRDEKAELLAELTPIPYPSLEGAVAAVQRQVEESQRKLEAILGDPESAPEMEAVAQSYADLGLAYVLYDFPDAAAVCFDNARHLMPDDYRWTYLAGYVRKLQGLLPEAIPLLERSLELEPGFLPAILRLGRSRLELDDLGGARALFEEALRRDPDSAAALEGLGRVAIAEGETEKAVDYFQRSLTLAPRASSLHYALAQAFRDLGRLDEAREQLDLRGDAAVPIPDPLISPLAITGESAQFYLIQGGEALDDKNYEGAAAAYRRALEKDPGDFVGYKGLSYSLEKLGDLEGAIENLERGVELGTTGRPDKDREERADLHRILGALEALRGDDERAVTHFRKSLELEEDQPGTRLKLANALSRLGRYEEALPHYGALIETEREFEADILVRRAAALVNLERGDEALADFGRAIELQPGDPLVHTRYADALEYLGRRREAAEQRALAEQAGRGSGGQIQVLVNRGNVASGQSRFEAALGAYSSALELAPERADIRFMRATALARLGNLAEAVDEFQKVSDAEPRHAAARHAEITALVLLERYGEARMRLNEALHIFSLDARLAHLQARLLATCPEARVRDGRIASEVARRLVEGVGGLRIRETLALAMAANGETARAADLQRQLIQEAEAAGDSELAANFRSKLAVLEAGGAWAASGPREIVEAAQEMR